ncbi:MAG TPA: manganese efflux pump MntP family protein [Polyangiaceae bacterium]|nr:manganese efflux pump MntP family protein [Polyangiaceae bacterium]
MRRAGARHFVDMDLASIFALALGLAMDATAVAAARGLAATRLRPGHVALMALLFGGFQALMPIGGFWLGTAFGALVRDWDHWVAFVVLGSIGAKMLWEARARPTEHRRSDDVLFDLRTLLLLAIATSIDALAAGVTLPWLGAPLLLSLTVIGGVTAVATALGAFAGRRFGRAIGGQLEGLGGVFLIGLGTKILIEHLGLI